jgi:hypothetical protein
MKTFRLHGLTVSSEIPLDPGRAGTGEPDLVLRYGPPGPVGLALPAGRLVAQTLRVGTDDPFYTVTQDAAHWRLRVHGLCDVVLDAHLREAVFHLDPSADPGLEAVVAGGMLLAIVLVLRGHLVLHAGAVERSGAALAVAGRSGMGKSTVTTLLAKAGGTLVTDDLLRVDLDATEVRCRSGSSTTRLRPNAQELAVGGLAEATADGRTALALPPSTGDEMPLRAVIVPIPDREAHSIRVERPTAKQALVVLSSFPRVVGWQDPRTRGEQFMMLSTLVTRLPTLLVTLPWGPPFAPDLGDALWSALEGELRPPG